MLAYAAHRPSAGKRQSSPNALLIVISVHVALLAIVMSAKMDLPLRIHDPVTTIQLLPRTEPPPPVKVARIRPSQLPPATTSITRPQPVIATPSLGEATSEGKAPIDFGKLLGSGEGSASSTEPARPSLAVRHEARLLTPVSELKPPYPASKLASGEEGVLTLRLSIDERGRVIAVDPMGPADRAFLDSARRYLIGHWRYEPATEGDRPVASTVTITLQFRLDS